MLSSRVPPTWDDAAYLTSSFILWDRLAAFDLLGFLDGFSQAMGFKAPLIALLPFPVFLAAGKGFAQASGSQLLALAALSFFAWRIGDRLRPPYGGPLAVWMVNLTPIVYGLSRHFYVETLLAALCAAVLCFLLEGGRPKTLGALLGLGMLCKLTFPVYVGVPVLLLALRRRSWRDWAWTLGIAAAVASVWYARNAGSAILFARSAGYGATAASQSPWRLASAWDYVSLVVRQGWGWPHTCMIVAFGALLWRRTGMPKGEPARDAIALAAWALVPTLFFSTGLAPELRWSGPATAGAGVCLALLLARMLEDVPERLRVWAGAAVLVLPAAVYVEQTFGVRTIPPGSGAPTPYVWNGPPRKGGFWGQDKLWAFVAKDAASTPGVKHVVLAVSHKFFNSATADAYAVLHGWPARFRNYSRYPTAQAALRFIEGYGADYIISVEGLPEAELDPRLNRDNPAVLAAIRDGALPFRQWAEADLPNGAKARVFKRVRRRV